MLHNSHLKPYYKTAAPLSVSCSPHVILLSSSAEAACLPQSDLSLPNLQLYSRPNIGVGMLGWAVYVSHNKASHKGVALSLTSSHLTARHGQVVCMETRLCSEVQALPTLLSSGEAERLLPPASLLLAALFGVFLRDLCPVTTTLTFAVFVCTSLSSRFLLDFQFCSLLIPEYIY